MCCSSSLTILFFKKGKKDMKKFEATRRNSIDGKWYNIKRTDFVYDGKPGSYYKMWDDKVNSHCVIYDDHDCIWSINHGPLGRFGRMFDVPKYQEFIDYVGILFNIEVPTITYDTGDLVIYNSTPPSKPDNRGIVKIMYQFIFNGIHGKYTQYKTDYKIENVIEYDGLKSVVIEWIIDCGLEYKDDCFPLPKYSDFVSQFKDTFVLSLPTVNKSDNIKSGEINIDISTVNKPDTDMIEIPVKTHKQEEKISNTSKITILDKTEDRYNYEEYECIDSVTKFMYNGKEGKYTKNVFGSIVDHTIEYNGFKTLVKSNRNEPEGDRYELPEHSDFVNQIRDAFGVELPIIKREHNKITILKKTERSEREIHYTTYEFEFNGKPGTCTHRNGENINATRIEYDGEDKEWGYYSGDWDCTSYTFTDPKYDEFKKSAKEVLHAYDFPNR